MGSMIRRGDATRGARRLLAAQMFAAVTLLGGAAAAQDRGHGRHHSRSSLVVPTADDVQPAVGPPVAVAQPAQASAGCACCVPGAQVACACGGGSSSYQVCNPSGTAYEPCHCFADPPPPPPPPAYNPAPVVQRYDPAPVSLNPVQEARPARRWYGWQTAILDGVGYAVAAAGVSEATAPLYIGFSIQTLGIPIVHWVHGNMGAGFGSLGLRLVGSGLVVAGAKIEHGDNFGTFAALGGLFLVGTSVLDIVVWPYDRAPAASERSVATRARWAPTDLGVSLMPDRGGLWAGVSGRF